MASTAENVPQASVAPVASPRVPWMLILWFAALLIVCYFPVLEKLVKQWATDEDVGHGFFVPLVAGYVAWQRRDQILATRLQPSWWGLALVLWGGLQGYLGVLGAELFLQRTAFLVSLVGIL